MMWKNGPALISAFILAAALANPASASSHSSQEIDHLKRENAAMKEMLVQMQQQIQDLAIKTNALQQQAQKAASSAGAEEGRVKSEGENITIATTGGGIQVKSSSGNEFRVGGSLMFDYDSYDGLWDPDDGEDGEESEIRRSRISLSGKSGKNWSYKFTVDIDHEDEAATVDTGYLKYSSKPMYAQLGKFKRPGMLEERTSSKWISTIERSIVNELSDAVIGKPDFGGIAVGFSTQGDLPMSGSVGLYDDEVEGQDDGDGEENDDDVFGLGARFSITPKFGDDSFLHAGASFYNVDYDGNDYRLRTRMGVHTVDRPFQIEAHATDDVTQYGVELAYVNGPFSLQGEFMNVESDGTDDSACGPDSFTYALADGSDADEDINSTCDTEMDGFYLQAAYTLTGETRGYGAGAFNAIKPKDTGGAWEVVARYEDAEVDIPARGLSADLERAVLGVNWYANKNLKFMLNYIDAEMGGCTREYTYTGPGEPTSSPDPLKFDECSDEDGNAISLRGQYVF